MLLDTAAAAMILLAEAKAEAVASGVTATTTSTSTSTSTCHKYQYKRGGSGSKQGAGREGKEKGKKPGKYSSCEVATQDKRHRARTRHCFLAESVLNTFRTYLKCCSFPLPPPPLSPLLAYSTSFSWLHSLCNARRRQQLCFCMIYRTDTRLFVVLSVICILFTTGKLLKHLSHLLAKHTPFPAHTLANTHKAL